MAIRPIADSDIDAVLALNEESVVDLSPMDADALATYRSMTSHVVVDEVGGEVAAFAIAYPPGTDYWSINYKWHSERFDDFFYVDRIVVGSAFRRRGIAGALYDELEAAAAAHGRMVCEVNNDPPNVQSLAFHAARGYREIGHLAQLDGHDCVMLEKPL